MVSQRATNLCISRVSKQTEKTVTMFVVSVHFLTPHSWKRRTDRNQGRSAARTSFSRTWPATSAPALLAVEGQLII